MNCLVNFFKISLYFYEKSCTSDIKHHNCPFIETTISIQTRIRFFVTGNWEFTECLEEERASWFFIQLISVLLERRRWRRRWCWLIYLMIEIEVPCNNNKNIVKYAHKSRNAFKRYDYDHWISTVKHTQRRNMCQICHRMNANYSTYVNCACINFSLSLSPRNSIAGFGKLMKEVEWS